MIPIKEAISSSAWLHCEYTYRNEFIQFRLRVVSFRKLDLSEVDEPEKIKVIDGQWWLMKIEVVSLTKESLYVFQWKDKILLCDQDGFKFKVTSNDHLWYNSHFSIKSGLRNFSSSTYLIPKIKETGSLAFLLPMDEAEYSLLMDKGNVREA